MISSMRERARKEEERVSRARRDWARPAMRAPETEAVRKARMAAAMRASRAVKARVARRGVPMGRRTMRGSDKDLSS
jgi:hypothetical protein